MSETKANLAKLATELTLPATSNLRKLAIYIGDPDPDSIASGLAVSALFKHTGVAFDRIDLVCGGLVSHEQNRKMINVLHVNLLSMSEASSPEEPIVSRYSHFVFVDCVPRDKWSKDIKPLLVIDHHKESCEKAVVEDIRQNCGSCCSIVWEYLKEAGYPFEVDDGSIVATALFFGIQNDTHDFTSDNCSDLDFAAFSDLSKHIDKNRLKRILDYDLPECLFTARQHLYVPENHIKEGPYYIGFAGMLTEKQRNCMDMLADETVRMEGIETAIICGVVGDSIQINVRNQNDATDVNDFCRKVFGKAYGGGKAGAGRIVYPLGPLEFSGDDEKDVAKGLAFVWAKTKTRIQHAIRSK